MSNEPIEYASEDQLMTEFQGYMKDSKNLQIATEYLYNSLIDEQVLGIAFEIHHNLKTGEFRVFSTFRWPLKWIFFCVASKEWPKLWKAR